MTKGTSHWNLRLNLDKKRSHEHKEIIKKRKGGKGNQRHHCALCCHSCDKGDRKSHQRKGAITRFKCVDCNKWLCDICYKRWHSEKYPKPPYCVGIKTFVQKGGIMIDSKKTCPKVKNEKSVATSTSSVITRKGDSTSQSTTSMTTLDHPNEEAGDDESNLFRFHYERNIDEGKRKDYMITVVRSSSE